jgi:DinB family protein
MAETTHAAQNAFFVARLLETCDRAVRDLSPDELHDTMSGRVNSIGFDVWHVVRTADNVVHFVFEREMPLWVSQGFFEKWGLPRVDQGTGMEKDAAFNLRFPDASEFQRYITTVKDAIVPRIAAMSDEYLSTITRIAPWGEIPRMEAIGQVLISHGNGHLGRADLARSLIGKPGLGY